MISITLQYDKFEYSVSADTFYYAWEHERYGICIDYNKLFKPESCNLVKKSLIYSCYCLPPDRVINNGSNVGDLHILIILKILVIVTFISNPSICIH